MFSRRTLWIVLAALALAGLAWFVVSIRRTEARKLTSVRLEAARQLWKEKGPRTYVLRYAIVLGSQPDQYEVKVENGKAVAAAVNGKAEPAERLYHYGMDRLFTFIERFLHLDADDKQTVHLADFDAEDGHLLRYQRHKLATSEFVDIRVEAVE